MFEHEPSENYTALDFKGEPSNFHLNYLWIKFNTNAVFKKKQSFPLKTSEKTIFKSKLTALPASKILYMRNPNSKHPAVHCFTSTQVCHLYRKLTTQMNSTKTSKNQRKKTSHLKTKCENRKTFSYHNQTSINKKITFQKTIT